MPYLIRILACALVLSTTGCLSMPGCAVVHRRSPGGTWTLVTREEEPFSYGAAVLHIYARYGWVPFERHLHEAHLSNDGGMPPAAELRWRGETALLTYRGLQEQRDVTFEINPFATPQVTERPAGRGLPHDFTPVDVER